MPGFSFLHAADIHLDSPFLNLGGYDGAPVELFRGATRRAFDNLVQLAINEQVAFILIAGDLFDGDCSDFNTPIYLKKKLIELGRNGVGTFVVLGNHDAQSRMKKGLSLNLPETTRILSADTPETVKLEDVPVAIHGQSFARPRETKDLSVNYPAPCSGRFNIGLLHTNCGATAGHGPYAPSSVGKLAAHGYDYWALGHIHKRNDVRKNSPWIVYPGNTQGRHINESGAKGCSLVRVDDASKVRVEHRDLDVCRWVTVTVDASACEASQDIVDLAEAAFEHEVEKADDRPLAARVCVGGTTSLASNLRGYADHWGGKIRHMAIERFTESIWVEKVKFDVTAPKPKKRKDGKVDSGVTAELAAIKVTPEMVESALDEIRGLLEKIPRDPRGEQLDANIEDPEYLEQLAEEAKQILVARLHGEGEGE
jgi:DNA repair exonuclease SbcCD nuclease subunit